MNWTGGPKAWDCWAGADIKVGEVVVLRSFFSDGTASKFLARDKDGNSLGYHLTVKAAKDAVERVASR